MRNPRAEIIASGSDWLPRDPVALSYLSQGKLDYQQLCTTATHSAEVASTPLRGEEKTGAVRHEHDENMEDAEGVVTSVVWITFRSVADGDIASQLSRGMRCFCARYSSILTTLRPTVMSCASFQQLPRVRTVAESSLSPLHSRDHANIPCSGISQSTIPGRR